MMLPGMVMGKQSKNERVDLGGLLGGWGAFGKITDLTFFLFMKGQFVYSNCLFCILIEDIKEESDR